MKKVIEKILFIAEMSIPVNQITSRVVLDCCNHVETIVGEHLADHRVFILHEGCPGSVIKNSTNIKLNPIVHGLTIRLHRVLNIVFIFQRVLCFENPSNYN
jgi:hypothetical protein